MSPRDEVCPLLARIRSRGARVIAVGSDRSDETVGATVQLADAWRAGGGEVSARVSWPDEAASWLRQARRLTVPAPDLWILGGAGPGTIRLLARLVEAPGWSPARTLAFSGVGRTTIIDAIGADVLAGMCGVSADGGRWLVTDAGLRVRS